MNFLRENGNSVTAVDLTFENTERPEAKYSDWKNLVRYRSITIISDVVIFDQWFATELYSSLTERGFAPGWDWSRAREIRLIMKDKGKQASYCKNLHLNWIFIQNNSITNEDRLKIISEVCLALSRTCNCQSDINLTRSVYRQHGVIKILFCLSKLNYVLSRNWMRKPVTF